MNADNATPSERLVQSVDRALRLVELLCERSGDTGLSELAVAANLPQGTTHRILRTLNNRGWVRRSGERRYAPGTTLIRFSTVAQRALAMAAEPYLAELVAVSGKSPNLAVLEGNHAVYLAQVPSRTDSALSPRLATGFRSTAQGSGRSYWPTSQRSRLT